MLSKDDVKARIFQQIDSRADEIIAVSKTILENPEPGFREVKTSSLVASKFAELGIPFQDGLALTGVKGELQGGSQGPSVALMGELDSLIVNSHPHADPTTGAAHACGRGRRRPDRRERYVISERSSGAHSSARRGVHRN